SHRGGCSVLGCRRPAEQACACIPSALTRGCAGHGPGRPWPRPYRRSPASAAPAPSRSSRPRSRRRNSIPRWWRSFSVPRGPEGWQGSAPAP
ncbi:hypothetical protein BFDFBN_BFDFBN_10735, partial [Dysosmobacter welbionis]